MTMAYDFLKKLFKKDENGAIIPMTAEELEAAIDADKNIKIVDLSAGGYIAKDKFDAKETELKGVKKQLKMPTPRLNHLRIRTLTESRKRFLSGNRSITPILRH